MTNLHIISGSAEEFPTAIDEFKAVQLNPHKDKFIVLVEPSKDDIEKAIEEYASARLIDRWEELNEQLTNGKCIVAFAHANRRFVNLPHHAALRLIGVSTFADAKRNLANSKLDEQREWLAPVKPNSVAEMLATYQDTSVDQTGYNYLRRVLSEATSGFDFLSKIIDGIFTDVSRTDYTLGTPRLGRHQQRAFEFLALARKLNWLLFPFLAGESGVGMQEALLHWVNTSRYTNQHFAPPIVQQFVEMARSISKTSSSFAHSAKYIRGLTVATDIFHVAQLSEPLLDRCLGIVDNGKEHANRPIAYARTGYNALIHLYNSLYAQTAPLSLLAKTIKRLSLDEFASFDQFLRERPDLLNWGMRMSGFLRQREVEPAALRSERTHCEDILRFLFELPNPPQRPEEVKRAHINNFQPEGFTFRHYLSREFDSPAPKNARLFTFKSLLDYVRDCLLEEHQGQASERPWFENPVDLRLDGFKEAYRAGSTRKAIPARILEMAREILVENDYAWPKQFPLEWTVASDSQANELVHVWCPSTALCLYTLLSVPLRTLQARLFDSGRGDAYIFDFGTQSMVPNPRPLPVDGVIDPNRREGVIQVMPSGISAEPELTGLWIPVNKSSGKGYPIPWLSDDLLAQLKYQHAWIARYTSNPKAWGIVDAQGQRRLPEGESAQKFFPLFPDAAAIRGTDATLPIAKQKLLKMWGQLCLEVERRMNAEAGHRVVTLVRPETADTRYPLALHDLHSLRVSGVTDLLDRGVPIEIVQEYVTGHRTAWMVGYYNRPAPGSLRAVLQEASKRKGSKAGLMPFLSDEEALQIRPHLVSMTDGRAYSGFDALTENKGLAHMRSDGICPGTRCEEGALDDKGRIIPVPMGDRGPSCPQCRFFLSGAPFLLGQVIEGNKLIFKIRKKVLSLVTLREKVMDAEDGGDERERGLAAGRVDVEERHLNDMLTEWWHRMRIYEESLKKLPDYEAARDAANADAIATLEAGLSPSPQFGYTEGHPLELAHYLSTVAEILPDEWDASLSAHQDIEIAVGKFLAMSEGDLLTHYFTLPDKERLTAANLSMEILLNCAESPSKLQEVLDGKATFKLLPEMQDLMRKVMQPTLHGGHRLGDEPLAPNQAVEVLQ